MLAAEAGIPVGSNWAFEFLWDGLRAVAYLRPERARLLSGTDRSITAGYPELAVLSALADRHGPLVLDGKIMVLDQRGHPNPSALRRRTTSSRPSKDLLSRAPATFYAFDLLYGHGGSTLDLPYRRRRELLDELDLTGLPVESTPYFLDTDGQMVLHAAQGHGLAGVVAKRLDSRYLPGRRSRSWTETVPRHTQRVVLGGWEPERDSERVTLLVGLPEGDGLRYLGRVRLDAVAGRALAGRWAELARPDCPFENLPPRRAGEVRWLRPVLVGEVSYRRRDSDELPRSAGWLGLCEDARPASARDPAPPAAPSGAPAVELASLEEAVRLARAETRALRAQISPHVFYNTLNTISSALRTDPDRARELLHTYADYGRYSFRAGASATTLGEELANARRYLDLEVARFGDRLRVEVEVPDELLAVPMPFMGLQRLVEHVVQHGIEGTPRGGTVRVAAVRDGGPRGGPDGGTYLLTVTENATAGGPGMEPDALDAVLSDVRHRLDAAPGPAATVRADRVAGVGTTITLRLPLPAGRLGR